MWWQYALVFAGALVVDIVPIPLPPAFTVMIFLQIYYKLDLWAVILVGVSGSIVGRYILSIYIPKLSGKIFKASKNEDAQYLGRLLKKGGWKGMAIVLVYSLMPLPTTPLFIAGGMAKLKPVYIIPPFIIGKLISDTISVLVGRYAADNTHDLVHGLLSFKSIAGAALGLSLLFVILFVDWHTLLRNKRFVLKFHIWKKHAGKRASS
jgi:membrane protein DedA with SNARE-associated domain